MKLITDRASILVAFEAKFPFTFNELVDVLSDHGFGVAPEGHTALAIDKDGRRHVLQKLVGDEVEILYSESEGRITANSDMIGKVLDTAKKILKQLKTLPDFELTVKWFELNHNARVFSEKHPMDMSWRKNKTGSAILDKITGLRTQPYTETICAFGNEVPQVSLTTIPEWLHFSVGPFVPNPRYFAVNVVYRRTSLDDVVRLGKKLPSLIENVINDL
jgi:hypothetical protein